MRTMRKIVSLLLAGVMMAGATTSDAATKKDKKHWWNGEPWTDGEPFHWEGSVDRGVTIEVHGINGDIHAVPSTSGELVVDAKKRGKKDDPDEVVIEVVKKDDGGLLFCARYPSPSGDLNDCEGGQNVQNCDVTVEFRVQVPSGVRFEPQTVNGGIDASGLRGPIDAATVNGTIELETSGSAEARTVNGSITAVLGKLDGDLEFETVNGSIEVTVPRGSSFDLTAKSANGSVDTDLPVTISGRQKRNQLRGQVGNGGFDLRMTTVNGGIDINAD